MNKKLVVIGVVLLIALGGGIFLLQQQPHLRQGFGGQAKKQYSATPTKWSQAGDYEIKEVAGPLGSEASQQTVVANKKAGFSFRVPEGWTTEHREGSFLGEYIFNMRSPDAKFDGDEAGNEEVFIRSGCVMSIETEYQKSTVDSLKITMSQLQEAPENSRRIVQVATYPSLQTDFFPPPSKYLEAFGETITIEMPLTDELLLRFGTRYLPKDKNKCVQTLDEFIENVSVEI